MQQTINISQKYARYLLIVVIGFNIGSSCFAKRKILNEQTQSALTPDTVLQDLINGNKRFSADKSAKRSSSSFLAQKASVQGQFPKAVILACMDSRSIPELVFDQSIADIFTLRVAGNIVSDEMIASMEYATKHSGSRLIVIMGHTQCGAIEAACHGKEIGGYLDALIDALRPAVSKVKKQHHGKLDCTDNNVIKSIAWQNVRNMKALVPKKSKVIRNLLADGTIKIVGAVHDLASGIVTFE